METTLHPDAIPMPKDWFKAIKFAFTNHDPFVMGPAMDLDNDGAWMRLPPCVRETADS